MLAKKYVLSKYLRTIVESNERVLIFHSLFGRPAVTTPDALEMLEFFKRPHTFKELSDCYVVSRKTFNEFRELYYIVPEGWDEREFLRGKLEERKNQVQSGALIKYLRLFTADCNFGCRYCSVTHIDQLGCQPMVQTEARFSWDTAKLAVDALFALGRRHGQKKVRIRFFGGEPMRDWKVYKRVIEYASTQSGPQVEFYLNTNGSIMSKAIAEFLRKFRVKTIVSVDGIGEVNDKFRVYPEGQGTFAQVKKGVLMLQRAGTVMHINITLHRANLNHLLEVVDFAKQVGAQDVGLEDLCFIEGASSEFSTDKQIETQKVLEAWRYGRSVGIPVLGSWSGFRDSPQFHGSLHYCGGNGEEICVDHKGSVFPCFGLPVSIGHVTNLSDCFLHPMYEAHGHAHCRQHPGLRRLRHRRPLRWSSRCRCFRYFRRHQPRGRSQVRLPSDHCQSFAARILERR